MSAELTAADALTYLAPRPRYTAARISAAAKAIGSPMIRLDFNGCYGWNVHVGKGDFLPFRTLAEVAAWLIADAEPVAVMATPAPMAPGPVLPGEVRPPAAPKQDGPLPELPAVTPWHRLTRGQAEAAWHAMLNRAVARHKIQAPMSHD